MIGRITAAPFVETVKNGEAKALFAQVQLSHNGEARTVQLFPGINADRWPCKDDVVVVERAGGLLYATAVWDKEEPKLKPGEYEIYSRNSERKRVARLYLDDKGKVVLEADDDIKIETKKNLDIKVNGDCNLNTNGTTNIVSAKNVVVNGAKIDLN